MVVSAGLKPRSGIKPLYDNLARLGGVSKVSMDEAAEVLKNVNTGVRSVDDVIRNLKVTKNSQGNFLLGGIYVGKLTRLLKMGDLDELIKASKLKVPLTSADVSAFKELIGKTPESGLKNVDDMAAVAKRELPQLDADLENFSRMSNTAKRDLKKVESNLYRHFKEGTVIALTVGTVYVGADWIYNATIARKGCFMVTTIDGVTTSCKISSFTCSTDMGVEHPGSGNCNGHTDYYNTTLVLMHLVTLPDSNPYKIAIGTATGIPVGDLREQLPNILDDHYPAVIDAVKKMGSARPSDFSVCGIKHESVENGVVPLCRVCDPTADPVSTAYIDPAQYGDNVTFKCVINPTILETISDTAISTGKNLLEGVNKAVWTTVRTIGIVSMIVLVLLVLFAAIARTIVNMYRNMEFV